MTTPPRARRFHISRDESAFGPNQGTPAGEPATPQVRLEVRKKGDLPAGFGQGPAPAANAPGNEPRAEPDAEPGAEPDAEPHPGPRADDPAAATDEDARRERMMRTEPVEDGFGQQHFPGATPRPVAAEPGGTETGGAAGTGPDDAATLDARLAAIRAENLTERQLRIARRIATLHRISVASDHEAVLRLRERGIDPSHRAAVGSILSSEGAKAQAAPSRNAPAVLPRTPLPQRSPAPPVPAAPSPTPAALPSREALTEDRRAAEIRRIQREIGVRRRRRMTMLVARLGVFVFLPTAIMGWYYFSVATPLYATHAQFQIQQAETSGGGSSGGLFGGMQLAANTDSVAVQSYLTSRDAMLRLDADKGFKRTFQDASIDPVRRLAPDATNEAAYEIYRDMVKIGYDPTEGVINLEVIAPDPVQSQEFSLALISYAEGQIDQLTARLRGDQMAGAEATYADAEAKVLAAQRRVQELQQDLGVLDPVAEGSAVMAQIAQLETLLSTTRLELGQLLSNPRPQQSRVDAARGEIARLEQMIADTRQQLTEGNDTRASLASISGELRIAESDLATRQELLAGSAAQMETARIEANKQVRYLSLSVAPVPPDEPTYPKALQNTLVSFLIFSGIYLMMSLTASILREQVTS